MNTTCPICGKAVDPLRSRHVGVRAGKVVAYCSAEHAREAETKPTMMPVEPAKPRTPAGGVPKITVPLNPGKNITVIAEVIAMNHLLRYAGINPAESFNQRLMGHMQQKAADVRRYLIQDDE